MIKKISLCLFILLLGLVACVGYSIISYSEKNYITPSDAAIVLGAAIIGDQPSPVFRERINHGVFLYKSGVAKKIIFTGGIGKGLQLSESEIAQRYAIKHGVNASDIFTREKIHNHLRKS